jgi:hypothetical protein
MDRPQPPFLKYHGKTDIYSLPYPMETDLRSTTFSVSAGEDARSAKTLDTQIAAVSKNIDPTAGGSFVLTNPTLEAACLTDGNLVVISHGLEAYSQGIFLTEGIRGGGWSGVQPTGTNYLWVRQVEEDRATGKYRSSTVYRQAEYLFTATGDLPSSDSVLIATWESGVGFNMNPTGKVKPPLMKDHRAENTDPHSPYLAQTQANVGDLTVMDAANLRGPVDFGGPEEHRGAVDFQGPVGIQGPTIHAGPVNFGGNVTTDLGVPVDGRDFRDVIKLEDGSTFDAGPTGHRHRPRVPAIGFMGLSPLYAGWSTFRSTEPNIPYPWPVDPSNSSSDPLTYLDSGHSFLRWPMFRQFGVAAPVDADYAMTIHQRADDEGTNVQALDIRSDIPVAIEFRIRVPIPRRFASLRSISIQHQHSKPYKFFGNAAAIVSIRDSAGTLQTLGNLSMAQLWSTVQYSVFTGSFTAGRTLDIVISGIWPTTAESGVTHSFGDIIIEYNTIATPIV